MRIIELPFELWPGHAAALACLVERPSPLTVGWSLYLGNGVSPTPSVQAATLTFEDTLDDAAVIYRNGEFIRSVEGAGYDLTTVFDLAALARAAGRPLEIGDVISVKTRDNTPTVWQNRPWTASVKFAHKYETYSGGDNDSGSTGVDLPEYHDNGEFTIATTDVPVATSYNPITTGSRFAILGNLLADYSADRATVDPLGPILQLGDVDGTLDEQSTFDALSNNLLVFVGDEVMSVAGVTLVGPRQYQLSVVRARYATRKESHGVGAAAYLIARDDLQPITHPHIRIGNELAVKLTLRGGGILEDLADVEPTSFFVAGEALALEPENLRVNGDLRNARYNIANPLRLAWSTPALRSSLASALRLKYRTKVEILDGATVLYSKLTYANTMTLTAVKLAAILGVVTDFTVRLTTDVLSAEYRSSSDPITLDVIPV